MQVSCVSLYCPPQFPFPQVSQNVCGWLKYYQNHTTSTIHQHPAKGSQPSNLCRTGKTVENERIIKSEDKLM